MRIIPNPIFLYHYFKNFLYVDRLWKIDSKEIKDLQTKLLKKMLKFSKNVPLYRHKFEKSNISLEDIQDVNDIKKIPFTTKQDLRDFGVKGTLPKNFNIDCGCRADTSGSTGEPISIYRDIRSMALETTLSLRMLKSYNLPFSETRITNIGDFTIPNSHDEECINKGVVRQLGFISSYYNKKVQNVFTGKNPKEIIKNLSSFNPDLIISYPGPLIALMHLRQEGYGENINPKYIVSSGGMVDSYTKKQIENAFDTQVLGLYAATESGGIAFECPLGNYHIQSDHVIIDAVDDNGDSVAPGEHGHLVVTRLYGRGTPIIRYTGMDDIITPTDEKCECGMNTPLLDNVEGRRVDSIVLPDGRIFPPATITLIPGEIAEEYGVDIIKRFQIIQHKKDKIEILIVINQNLRGKVPSVEEMLDEIKNRYKKIVGESVFIEVKEVDEVKKDKRSPGSPSSIIISKVDHKDWI
ncbi:MAG: hypothetical protein V5A68_07330 [Candidatus Thermoplasmatota archaeon]